MLYWIRSVVGQNCSFNFHKRIFFFCAMVFCRDILGNSLTVWWWVVCFWPRWCFWFAFTSASPGMDQNHSLSFCLRQLPGEGCAVGTLWSCMFAPCCGCIHHCIKCILKCGLNLQCIVRSNFIKSWKIAALAQYLQFVQMMVCREKLGSPFCVSLSQEVFIPENGSACTPVLLPLKLCKSYQICFTL